MHPYQHPVRSPQHLRLPPAWLPMATTLPAPAAPKNKFAGPADTFHFWTTSAVPLSSRPRTGDGHNSRRMPVIREKTQNNRDNRLFLNNSIAIFRSGTIESCPKIECQAFFGAPALLSARRDRKIIESIQERADATSAWEHVLSFSYRAEDWRKYLILIKQRSMRLRCRRRDMSYFHCTLERGVGDPSWAVGWSTPRLGERRP